MIQISDDVRLKLLYARLDTVQVLLIDKRARAKAASDYTLNTNMHIEFNLLSAEITELEIEEKRLLKTIKEMQK